MVSEEGSEEEWSEEDEWNDSWNEGYWADDQDWNDGCWATEGLQYKDEYGYQKGKKGRKGKKEKKGKKGKDDEGKGGKPGDRKGKSNYVQPQTSSAPAIQNRPVQHEVEGMVLFFSETDPARVDVRTVNYEEQEYHRRTRRVGQHQQWRRETGRT